MTPFRFFCAALGALIFGLAGCRRAPEAPVASALTSVVLQTNWYAEADHGGYYQALAKGFYREAGLDVRIQQGGPGAFQVQKVATGQVQFAIARSDDVILAAQQKLPVLMLSSQLQHDPQIIMVHASSPVKGFADLDGRSVMVEPGSAWVTYLERKFKIKIQTIPVNYGQGAFIADKSTIQQGFLTNEPFIFEQLKVPTRVLLISDCGYDPYRAVVTNRTFAQAHPDAVRAFVAASIRGWEDYLHGDAAPGDALIMKDDPKNTPELLAFARRMLNERGVVGGDAGKGERVGLIARKRLAEQLVILKDLGLLTVPLAVDDVAAFEYLPKELQALAK